MTKEEYYLNPNKCKVCNSIIEYNSRARVRTENIVIYNALENQKFNYLLKNMKKIH